MLGVAARADRLRAHAGLDRRGRRARAQRGVHLRRRRPHGDGVPTRTRSCARPCSAPTSRSPTASRSCGRCNLLGHDLSDRVYGPDLMDARLRARRADRRALLPLRRARRTALAQLTRNLRAALSRPADRRRLRAAVPRADRRRGRDEIAAEHQRLRRGRRLGRHRRAAAGEVDGARCATALDAPVLVGVGAAFDFHAGLVPQAPDVDAAARARVGVPPRAGAAPPVAALPALQPALRRRVRAPVGRAAPRSARRLTAAGRAQPASACSSRHSSTSPIASTSLRIR